MANENGAKAPPEPIGTGSGAHAAIQPMADAPHPTTRYRYYVLGILTLVYTLNFLDRQILALLKTPIQKELGISNSAMGVMSGITFSLLYCTLGIPVASLADRSSRKKIMAWALGIWSLFTAMCGFATSIWHLALARVGVGFGEAGGVAPAYSLVSDYFPKHQRARALSIFSLGIPVGSAAGLLVGGLVAAAYGWRWAFISVGTIGLVLAPIFFRTVKDPKRGGYEATTVVVPTKPARFIEVFDLISRKRSFWLLALGAAMSSVCGYGIAFWLPNFLTTTFFAKSDPTVMPWFYAGVTFVGGVIGVTGGGIVADKLGGKRRSVYALAPAIAFVIALPCMVAAMNQSSAWAAFPLFVIPTGLNLLWLGPVLTAVQHLVPGRMRSTASAMFLLINNLLGIAVGYSYFGAVADVFAKHGAGKEAMRYAIYTGLGFYVIATVLFLVASKGLQKNWVDETTGEGLETVTPRSATANKIIAAGAAVLLTGLIILALRVAGVAFAGVTGIVAFTLPLAAGLVMFVTGLARGQSKHR